MPPVWLGLSVAGAAALPAAPCDATQRATGGAPRAVMFTLWRAHLSGTAAQAPLRCPVCGRPQPAPRCSFR